MATGRPVVFIHGLWLHATSWGPWLDRFREHGYEPVAPGWPHEPDTVEEARAQPEAVAGTGIDDGHAPTWPRSSTGYAEPPVIIGHSFGGLIAEKLLGAGHGAAAVAIDPAQIKGVLPLPLAQLRAGLPALGNPANLHRAVSLTRERSSASASATRCRGGVATRCTTAWTIPSPARPLFQAAAGQLRAALPGGGRHPPTTDRGPLLLISGPRGPHGPGRRHPLDAQAVPGLRPPSPSCSSSRAGATR